MLASGGGPLWIRRDVSGALPSRNGCSPASDSQSITPTDQMSAASVAVLPSKRSGET